MATIKYGAVELGRNPGKALLGAFERVSVYIPYSCRNGTRMRYMMHATGGKPASLS